MPGEDAPDERLLDFWGSEDVRLDMPAAPVTDKLRGRLLRACEARPRQLPAVLRLLPETPAACEAVKAVYDREEAPPGEAHAAPGPGADDAWDDDGKQQVRRWLMTHGPHFRPELIAAAGACRYESGDSLENEDALRALAKLDWPAAEPLLRGYAAAHDPRVNTTAVAILYEHALSAGDAAAAGELRGRLEAVATDRLSAPEFARSRACEALLAFDWPGSEAWWGSLLADPTLRNMDEEHVWYPWPLERWADLRPDRAVPILVAKLAAPEAEVRDNAARLLSGQIRPDALRPLLPALTEPDKWPDGVRGSVVRGLQRVKLPESVPGLVRAWRDAEGRDRTDAALALAFQGAKEAAEALRGSFPDDQGNDERERFAAAMLACNALSEDEVATAVEEHAVGRFRRTAGAEAPPAAEAQPGGSVLADHPDLADFVAHQVSGRAELADRLLGRVGALRKDHPGRAEALWQELLTWPSAAVDREMMRRLRDERPDERAVADAVARAPRLRENAARGPGGLEELARGGGERGGLAAALLADGATATRLLARGDRAARRMLLAVARLGRTALPLSAVAELMGGPDAGLARAAEDYLVADDGPEAVRLVLARHPGEALVLGGGTRFPPAPAVPPAPGAPAAPDPGPPMESWAPLRAEVMRPDGPDEVFALFGGGGFGSPGDFIVRLRAGEARIESRPGGGKTLSRRLTGDERKALLGLVASTGADDLPTLRNEGVFDGFWFTYVHLTRAGGRWFYMNNPGAAGTAGTAYDRIARFFRRLPGAGPLEAHYVLQDQIPGSRVLWSDPKLHVAAVWLQGDDLRVRAWEGEVNDGAARWTSVWHAWRDGKIAEATADPPGHAAEVDDFGDVPKDFPIDKGRGSESWKVKAGDSTIRVGERWGRLGGGLWRCRKGREPERITKGEHMLDGPLTTPDGKWAVATDDDPGPDHPCPLVRVELASGEVRRFDLPGDRSYNAVAYLPLHGRILAWGALARNFPETRAFWLVDPATGKTEAAQGDFEPLVQADGRPLQPAGRGDEVWAAVPDRQRAEQTRVGRYDVRRFTFTPVLTLPGVAFDSGEMAVDEKAGQVYFAVNGDLLRVPLPGPAGR